MPSDDCLANLVPGVRRGETTRPGRTLRWLAAGSGTPVILLVPGAGGTSLDWLPVLPVLAQLSTTVAMDRAGLGASDPVRHITVEDQIEDLIAVLSQVTGSGPDPTVHSGVRLSPRPSIVVGHSWGGFLAQLVAQRRPDLVAGVVLVDSFHEELVPAVPRRLRLASSLLQLLLVPMHVVGVFGRITRSMAATLAARCTDDPDLRTGIEAEYRRYYRRRHHAATIASENRLSNDVGLLRRLRAGSDPPSRPVISLIATTGKQPTLQQVSTRVLASLAESSPRGRAIVVTGAGHYLHHDRPDAVIEAIASMMAAVSTN
jgi:pimeloyl-ACP methyl ester carboxylesterase